MCFIFSFGEYNDHQSQTKKTDSDPSSFVVVKASVLEHPHRPMENLFRISKIKLTIFHIFTAFLFIPGKWHSKNIYTFIHIVKPSHRLDIAYTATRKLDNPFAIILKTELVAAVAF